MPVTFWLTMLAMGVVTYATRLSLIVLLDRVAIPKAAQRALRFVPLAVLSAIIFPEILRPNGLLLVSLGNPRLLAGLVAVLVAWRSKNVLLTIGLGMGVFWGLQAVGLS